MKYMVAWTTVSGSYRKAADRFLKTGGKPPKGAKLLGRWIGLGNRGFALCESNDPGPVLTWVAQWADVLDIEAVPVVEDDDAARALKAARK